MEFGRFDAGNQMNTLEMERLDEIHGIFENTREKFFMKNLGSRVGHGFPRLEQCQDRNSTDQILTRYRSGICLDRFWINCEIFNLIKYFFY